MKNKKNGILLKTIIFIVILVLVICFILTNKTVNEQTNIESKNDILNYLNNTYKDDNLPSYSPIYGIMNFTFSSAKNISTSALIYSNIMSSSEADSTVLNVIYKDRYGKTKPSLESSSNFINSKEMNCYYHQNVLKQSGFNCDKVCSYSQNQIISIIEKTLKLDNILPEDVKTYCIKNPVYYTDSNFYVDLDKVKKLYKSITGYDIVFSSDVTTNPYYKYNSYLLNSSRFSDNINNVNDINIESDSNNIIIINYNVSMDSGKTKNGKMKLQRNLDGYYILENTIEGGYSLVK